MSEPENHRTPTGRMLTDEEIDALSEEVAETDYGSDPIDGRPRRRIDP